MIDWAGIQFAPADRMGVERLGSTASHQRPWEDAPEEKRIAYHKVPASRLARPQKPGHGAVVQWSSGAVAQWSSGAEWCRVVQSGAVEQWGSGAVVQSGAERCSGAVEQWRSGAEWCRVVQWLSGAVAQWSSGAEWCRGAAEQWCSGAVTQWRSGAVVQWCSSAVVPIDRSTDRPTD